MSSTFGCPYGFAHAILLPSHAEHFVSHVENFTNPLALHIVKSTNPLALHIYENLESLNA
jgi:hypothetical protein